MKKDKKQYGNKGKKYQKDEKVVILELFQEGHSKKDIARMLERKIDSIQDVIDDQIRNSIILSDEEFMRIKIFIGLVVNFAHHPLSKEVVEGFKDSIQCALMNHGEFTVDEIVEFLFVDSQLIVEHINLQQLFRKSTEHNGLNVYPEERFESEQVMTEHERKVEYTKEKIKKLRRWKDNILT